MSLLGKLERGVEIMSPANKFHGVFSRRPNDVSAMTPNHVQSCDLHKGQLGNPGTVICWNYTLDGETKVAKEIVEKIDDVNFSTTFKVIEGDLLKNYNLFRITVKATQKGEGSVVNWSLEYEKKKPETPHPNTLLDFLIDCTKDVDSHLISQLQCN